MYKFCFICNLALNVSLTKSMKRNFENMFETHTNHSNVPIYDLIPKFMGDAQIKRDLIDENDKTKWDSICLKCVRDINTYDMAFMTVQKLEKQISEQLRITEEYYETENVNIDGNDSDAGDFIKMTNDVQVIQFKKNDKESNKNDIIELVSSDDDGEIDADVDYVSGLELVDPWN